MKKRLYTASLNLILAQLTFANATDKIAVVNIYSIFQQSPQSILVAKQLEKEFKERADELRSIENDLQIKMHQLQRDSAIMQDSERNSLEKSLIIQRETLSTKVQAFEQDNRRRQTEERSKILDRIQDAVKNIANQEGYDLVIDASAVAYASDAKDITDDVLKQVK